MRLLSLGLIAAAVALPVTAQGVEARTGHFRVFTTASAGAASAAATALERDRSRLAALGLVVAPGSTDVLVFPTVEEMTSYSPGRAGGFFQQGSETSFIVIAWSGAGDPLRNLAHELAHQAIPDPANADFSRRPLWLREGLAELLSGLRPVPEGLRMGAPVAAHVQALQRQPWLEWRQVLEATRDSPWLQDPNASRMFYAQSWLLAHRLVVAKPGRLAERLATLAAPPELPETLPDPWPEEVLPLAPAEPPPEPAVRELAAWEWELHLAELLRAMDRRAEARAALIALRSRFPDRPEPAGSLGALEMDALHYDRAEEWFAEAVRLGSTDPATYYRYSLLRMRPGKNPEEAARYARRAVELDPSMPLYWLAQGQAEMQVGRWEAARESLAQMRERTADPLLLEQVRIELAEVDRRQEQERRPPRLPEPPARVTREPVQPEPPPAPPAEPRRSRPVARSQSWPPPGTLLFLGHIRQVECGRDEKILTVTNRVFLVRVRERLSAPARLYAAPKGMRAIPCSLQNVEVNVVYRPLGGFGPVNGDLVAVVF